MICPQNKITKMEDIIQLKIFETFSKKIDYRNGGRTSFFIKATTAQKILKPKREGSLVYSFLSSFILFFFY